MQDLRQIFKESLELKDNIDIDSLTYNSIPEWDSIGHMTLIAELEEAYDIMIDTDDILDMSSFEKAKEILTKYDVQF